MFIVNPAFAGIQTRLAAIEQSLDSTFVLPACARTSFAE